MNLVELDENRELIINPELYGFTRFKTLVDTRKGKDDDLIKAELLYVYFMHDIRSDFMVYNEDIRHSRVIEEVDLPEKWKPDTALNMFADLYKELTQTKIGGMLKTIYLLVDKSEDYIRNLDLEAVDPRTGKPLIPIKDAITAGNQLTVLAGKVEELETMYKRQLKESNNMRGGGVKNAYEDGFNNI